MLTFVFLLGLLAGLACWMAGFAGFAWLAGWLRWLAGWLPLLAGWLRCQAGRLAFLAGVAGRRLIAFRSWGAGIATIRTHMHAFA